MNTQNKIDHTELVRKRCGELFFELGKLLALCKTCDEQQQQLSRILLLLEAGKERSKPHESTTRADTEIQQQLTRYYIKGFVRWGLTQKKSCITNTVVKQGGMQLSYSEKTKRREKYPIPRNLRDAFNDGWVTQKTSKAA